MTIDKKGSIKTERLYDYLYDPLYSLSSARDHARRQKISNMDRLQKLYSFENYFSEIPIHKPFKWKRVEKDPVPASVPREFQPSTLCHELLKLKLSEAGSNVLDDDVVGRHRANYFSYAQSNPYRYDEFYAVESTLARNANQAALQTLQPWNDRLPKLANKAVQTILRDSEVQTNPFSPPYVVNVGETPEALTLASMGYGKGLPAGLHDVEMIERARQRRVIESSLEPYMSIALNPKKLAERKKLMENFELREWHYREKEVEALQEIRLKVLLELLRKREAHQQQLIKSRMDRIKKEKLKECKEKREAVQRKYSVALRKLLRRHLNTLEPKRKRDVIKDYANPSSQSFAPLTRLGVFPDRGSQNFAVRSAYLDSLRGLLELETSLNPHVLQPKLHIEPINMYTKDGYLKREFRHMEEMAKLQRYLDGAFKSEHESERRPRFLQQIDKVPPRPPTPTAVDCNDYSTEREDAVLLLQRLIRGRAIQVQMYEAKEKRKELIAELRSTHGLLEDDQLEKWHQKVRIQEEQAERAAVVQKEDQISDILSRLADSNLSEVLDFLSKELDRLIEERRVHARVMLAERMRRLREAEESGTRQREERRRREHDEIFKQLVKVHQDTVDGYLAEVAGLTLNSTADMIAREEFDHLAVQLDTQAWESEPNRTELQSDLIAAEMVHKFLIPEVNKQAYQKALDARHRKFLQAAHRAIWTPAHDAADTEVPSTSGNKNAATETERTGGCEMD